MTEIEILQKYDEAVSSFAAGLASGFLDVDQEKAFKERYELFKAGRDALRRTAEHDKAMEQGRLVELPCKVGIRFMLFRATQIAGSIKYLTQKTTECTSRQLRLFCGVITTGISCGGRGGAIGKWRGQCLTSPSSS